VILMVNKDKMNKYTLFSTEYTHVDSKAWQFEYIFVGTSFVG